MDEKQFFTNIFNIIYLSFFNTVFNIIYLSFFTNIFNIILEYIFSYLSVYFFPVDVLVQFLLYFFFFIEMWILFFIIILISYHSLYNFILSTIINELNHLSSITSGLSYISFSSLY